MKNKTFLTFLFLFPLFATSLASPVPRQALTNRDIRRWPIHQDSGAIAYYISASESEFELIAQEAMIDWESIPGAYIHFERVYQEEKAKVKIELRKGLDLVGDATIEKHLEEDDIVGCYVGITGDRLDDEESRLRGTLTHELGHCWGLDHSVVVGAVMSYRRGCCVTADDELHLSYLYGYDGDPQIPLGCGSMSTPKNSPPKPPASFYFLLAALALAWKAMRRPALIRF